MNLQNDLTIGNLPKNINKVIPTPNEDACKITKLIKHSNEVIGYELSNGAEISKQEGIQMAKSGQIKGVAVATNQGNEYLRTLPDGSQNNNLSSLPTIIK